LQERISCNPLFPELLHVLSSDFPLAPFKRRIVFPELPIPIQESNDSDTDVEISVSDVQECDYHKSQRDNECHQTRAFS
jgi:hypothetical protein